MTNRIRISLTGTTPVSIDLDVWHEVAGAGFSDDGASAALTVYKSPAGAHVVSGQYLGNAQPDVGREACDIVSGRYVPAGGDIVAAVRDVAHDMYCKGIPYGRYRRHVTETVAQDCLNAFPPLEL